MSSNKTMLDNRPYVLRSTLAWIEDSLCTPLLAVNPKNTSFPDFMYQGMGDKMIRFDLLNPIIRGVAISDEGISFTLRSNNIDYAINIPIDSILYLVASENMQGAVFREAYNPVQKKRAELRLVK